MARWGVPMLKETLEANLERIKKRIQASSRRSRISNRRPNRPSRGNGLERGPRLSTEDAAIFACG